MLGLQLLEVVGREERERQALLAFQEDVRFPPADAEGPGLPAPPGHGFSRSLSYLSEREPARLFTLQQAEDAGQLDDHLRGVLLDATGRVRLLRPPRVLDDDAVFINLLPRFKQSIVLPTEQLEQFQFAEGKIPLLDILFPQFSGG